MTQKQYIKKANDIHNNIYTYSNFIKMHDNVDIFCKEHGTFTCLAKNHIYLKQICPECRKKIKHTYNKLTINEFEDKCSKEFNNKYIYHNDYINMKSNITVTCKEHGDFKIVAQNHLYNKNGCVKCSNNFKKDKIWLINNSDFKFEDFDGYNVTQFCKNHNHKYITKLYHFLKGSSCPICKSSRGEQQIRNILKSLNILFKQEYKFKDCKNKNSLPFDFYLYEYNLCVEYDGIQHFKPVEYFGGDKSFKKQLINDKIKTQYCIDNNIKLLRIKYDDDIKEKLIEEGLI